MEKLGKGRFPISADPGGLAGFDSMKKAGFWVSVSDHLLMFPLRQPVRVVLLEMLCVGTKPYQVSRHIDLAIFRDAIVAGKNLKISKSSGANIAILSLRNSSFSICHLQANVASTVST